jgi:uncharacterized repeat protein (TIGR03803 family)
MSVIRWKNDLITTFETAGNWTDETALPTDPDAIPFNAGGGQGNAAITSNDLKAKVPTLTTLVSFTGVDGSAPYAGLIADTEGNLFGTTDGGGADGDGTVFEIAKTKHGYASTPTTLVSFTGSDGAGPSGSLIADADGNLFGTTDVGGTGGDGTVFEIAKTKSGYASAPTTLVSFTGPDGEYPEGSLISDASGDLFGMTYGNGDNYGTVFEIVKTKGGYASSPSTLVNFTGTDGSYPSGSLIADAAGDLFGMTSSGGADGDGTVFKIAKTKSGYADTPTTIVSFTGSDGAYPQASLSMDSSGDLFGTTYGSGSGTDGDGTVFEIVKSMSGYASTPTTLVSFTGVDGSGPAGNLIADPAGDLFGTTYQGGADNDGTVFEIAKTKSGYASKPTTLVSFTGANGANPTYESLTADAAGDLFGTSSAGGAGGDGTVFELEKTKGRYVFVQASRPVTPAVAAIAHSPMGAAFVQAMASHGASRFGSGGPDVLASRNDMPMLLSRPHAAY